MNKKNNLLNCAFCSPSPNPSSSSGQALGEDRKVRIVGPFYFMRASQVWLLRRIYSWTPIPLWYGRFYLTIITWICQWPVRLCHKSIYRLQCGELSANDIWKARCRALIERCWARNLLWLSEKLPRGAGGFALWSYPSKERARVGWLYGVGGLVG